MQTRSKSSNDVRRDRFDVDVEQVRHPQVFGPRHPLERRNHSGRPRAVQDGAQREAAGHRIRIGLVVQQDQDAIGVSQIALILLHTRARQGAAELGEERRFEELDRERYETSGNWSRMASARFSRSAVPTPST